MINRNPLTNANSNKHLTPISNVDPDKLLLTEREAARALSISARTLWELRKKNKIPYVVIGRSIRYPIQALKDWISDSTNR